MCLPEPNENRLEWNGKLQEWNWGRGHVDMEQQRKCLNACAQKLSLGLVWRELQVFSKLIYRGRNQHRRDKCYQRLSRVEI